MLQTIKYLKWVCLFFGLVSLSAFLNCCHSIDQNKDISDILLPKNYDCDSLYVTREANGNRTFYCTRKSKINYLTLNKNNDTLEVKRYLNSSIYERITFKNNKTDSRRIALNFEDFDYTIYSINSNEQNSFYIKTRESDQDVFFKILNTLDEVGLIDSITVFEPTNFFSSYGYVHELKVDEIYSSSDKWIKIPKGVLDDNLVLTILISYQPNNSVNDQLQSKQIAQRLLYVDQSIYKWAKSLGEAHSK